MMLFARLLLLYFFGVVSASAIAAHDIGGRGLIDRCEKLIIDPFTWQYDPSETWSEHIVVPRAGALRYLGSEHWKPESDPQYQQIENEFLKMNATLVLYEGLAYYPSPTKGRAIASGGEVGLIQYLARNSGIPSLTMEPSEEDTLRAMLGRYSDRNVHAFLVLRYVAVEATQKGVSGPALERRAKWMIDETRTSASALGVSLPLKDLKDLQAVVSDYWPGINWYQVQYEWFTPLFRKDAGKASVFHKINRIESNYRNRHMFRTIARAMLGGERVFAVVGRNHVPLHRPALKCLQTEIIGAHH